jgi:rhodanese-related sulfurtransferase
MTKIKFISLDQLLEMKVNNEKFKLVEVLSKESFKQGHIPGAISLPLDDLKVLAKKLLKKTDKIVTYCASYSCHASTNATVLLLKLGYKKTFDFKGSKKLWLDSGLDLEK